ncbi:hypothetical protein SAMN02910264_01387 [Ruminococcaceae bacterium YAD3003]|nr:hypothetical protein SAMN02910264_01387 [Ruminococcaceae bacterium YAD3003]
MGLFTEKYNSPFDNEQSRRKIDEKITVFHIRPARYLSTRGALFLGYSIISLCIEFLIPGNLIWWPVACSLACILIWSLTLRFFMPRNLSVISFAYVMALFIAAGEFSYRLGFCSAYASVGFVPMAIGIMSLARFKEDDNDNYTKPAFGSEVFLPFIIATACSICGLLISYVFEKRYLFIMLLVSVVFLIIMSWAFSRLTGIPRIATSKKLTEFWDIPVADISELKRFVFSRGMFAIISFAGTASLYVLKVFIDEDLFRIIALPVSEFVAILFGSITVYAARHNLRRSIFGLRYFISEVSFAAAFIALVFLVHPGMPKIIHLLIAVVFICATDIVMTGLLSVIRRRLIFVSKSRYIDGLPFYLILISLVVMLAETCLYSLPGL